MGKVLAPRWGDHDAHLGPFTIGRNHRGWRPLMVMLASAQEDGNGAHLRVSAFGYTLLMGLPNWLLQPERKKVYPKWDEATVRRLGRDWYWDETKREYGFTISEGHLSVHFGRQTHDSRTEQRWGCFLPWTQWRHVRHSLYSLGGELFTDLPVNARWNTPAYEEYRRLVEKCPTVTFTFQDFDGEVLTAATKIEEHEWLLGTKWCKWLSLLARPKVSRSLDIRFSGETGRRKGSWKGGKTGHSITLLPGELHEAAFRRYCAAHEMTFVALTAREEG
jgi:hypothetical protein